MSAAEMSERRATDCRPAPLPATNGSASACRLPDTRPDAISLGIVVVGQLAKMTAQAATQLGCKVMILERQSGFPAGSVGARIRFGP